MTGETLERFPWGPVRARFPGETSTDLARRVGTVYRQVRRWETKGLTAESADRVATALGIHPFEIWGDAWAREAVQ